MGQGQSTNLTDQTSSRPLPSTSTLEKLCGERSTYKVANADDCIYPMDAMRALGFVLMKNVFTDGGAQGNRLHDRRHGGGLQGEQAAEGIMWRNIEMQCLLEKILGKKFCYGGTGMDVAFPGPNQGLVAKMRKYVASSASGSPRTSILAGNRLWTAAACGFTKKIVAANGAGARSAKSSWRNLRRHIKAGYPETHATGRTAGRKRKD